jgi:lysine 2,3-aminomutase
MSEVSYMERPGPGVVERLRLYHAVEDAPAAGPMVGRPEVIAARPELARTWEAVDRLFPVRVTRSWWDRVDPTDPADPLARQVLPSPDELVAAPGDLIDPVGDAARSPVPWVVQKHPDRVLLLLTKRCHVYCRYCFRRTFSPEDAEDPSPEAWEEALAYATGCGAREAILSGGDPLAVRDDRLLGTIDRLRAGGLRVIRLHTRAPITFPRRVTDDLVRGLAARAPVWVVVHVNHPRELAPDVDAALARLVDAGIPVLNQAVLLRGVNDDVDVLAGLCEALVERRIRPYYLHHTDAAAGNGAFRVDPARGLELVAALRRRVSGIAFPRYVVDPPDGSGKIDVDAWAR